MLIYAAADLHGDPRQLAGVIARVALHRPDVVLLAGDTLGRRRPLATLAPLNRLGLPVLMIRGNSDGRRLPQWVRPYPHLRCLHLDDERVGAVRIVGLGGTLPLPFHSRLGISETTVVSAATRLLDTRSVLLVHPPPFGIRDRVWGKLHAGSRSVRRLVDRCRPAVVVCGHIHEQAGIDVVDGTWVVNCAVGRFSGGALIAYDGRSKPHCRMLAADV